MPRLTSEQRSEAIGMLRANVTVLQVVNHFNVSRICIWKLKTRFQTTGTVKDRPPQVIKNDIEYMLQTF